MSENNSGVPAPSAPSSIPAPESVVENEVVESSEAAPEAPASGDLSTQEQKAEIKQEIKKLKQLKLKIDGKEILENLPFEVEAGSEMEKYLQRELQLSKAAQKRMSEAKDVKSKLDEVGEYFNKIKGNKAEFRKLAREMDIDEKELAAMIVEEEIARSKKSPETLENERLAAELQKIQDDRKKEKEEMDSREYQRLVQQEEQRFSSLIESSLKEIGVPDNSHYRRMIVDYMSAAVDKGHEINPESMTKIVEMVKGDVHEQIKKMFEVAPDEMIENLVGKDKLKALRKKAVAKATPPTPVAKSIQETGNNQQKKEEPNKKISFKKYFGV